MNQQLLNTIKGLTEKGNRDNISRTKAYEHFFSKHPEIRWSLLAGVVSRNAGWNMCDLAGNWLPHILTEGYRRQLFLTYEEANWRIFQDAYPQLLLYHYSKKYNRPLFHLGKHFFMTTFMEKEWQRFWQLRDEKRLVYALIINEQHVIERPVIRKRSFVFHSVLFLLQDWLHYSTVLFPTCFGQLYGFSVANFCDVDARIHLGKKLYELLFSPDLFPFFYQFVLTTEPTGARYDYEQYGNHIPTAMTPTLRKTYPIIYHSIDGTDQWDVRNRIKSKWFRAPKRMKNVCLTDWYYKKQQHIETIVNIMSK